MSPYDPFMYIRFKDDLEIKLPEGMRITDGPRMSVRQVDWPKGVHFYKVTDNLTDECSYLTSVETALKCGISLGEFRRWYNRLRKNRSGEFLFEQYLIERIPKYLFVRITKRYYDEVTEYFYRY